MRSHPYTTPPPLPPLLAELSSYLPNRDRSRPAYQNASDSDIALAALDPETSRLLPQQQRKPHRVRVQGRLAPVRSVSVANLRAGAGAGYDEAVGGGALVRRRSCGGGSGNGRNRGVVRHGDGENRSRNRGENGRGKGDEDRDEWVSDDDEEEEEESNERDTQLRGYGIGGRGNIRRPTEVMGAASSRTSLSLSSIFSSPSRSGPGPGSAVDKKFSLAGLLNRIEERKGKERCV
ncbi:hypothetical protein F5Y04DRAFT_255937 [Hypomontagnella monticulosa]|nr:hypothetical protein F5Y04DRAFT_255937 [Hypomontagnella monticulosa]